MSKALEKIEQYQRVVLAELLAQCTKGQQRKFARIFPDGPEKMPLDKVANAVLLCERTVKKNKEEKDA
ncbi:hypothetical protein LCGC14_1730880 [marine sediment metagenome]|uniref:Uncharacterized protein n=1 Tax=marine sediment metagenome TaxID=412755 RepID=A0A0F9H9H4_9ZZZZ